MGVISGRWRCVGTEDRRLGKGSETRENIRPVMREKLPGFTLESTQSLFRYLGWVSPVGGLFFVSVGASQGYCCFVLLFILFIITFSFAIKVVIIFNFFFFFYISAFSFNCNDKESVEKTKTKQKTLLEFRLTFNITKIFEKSVFLYIYEYYLFILYIYKL